MATQDITRSATDPRKRYAGVYLQQGRVLVDDDWNEAERIAAEERRQTAVDVIGPVGSPDDGFRISDARITAGGELDFAIGAGTLYVGGLRVELTEAERFRLQRDWLSQPASERQPPTGARTDLVYVECWEQVVGAVEDSELFEVALAGSDTSTRSRTVARVAVEPDVGTDDCAVAWQALLSDWAAAGRGVLNGDHELVPDARLTVGFDPSGTTPGDLCTPAAAGGYLGAENQAIRVEIREGGGSFTWGYDNAAPLYRATVAADGRTVTLETEPKDHLHWPLAGQVVELLPWASVLPNGEKLAETTGHLARVEGSYDPDTRELTLTAGTALPSGFGLEWQDRDDAPSLGTPFFFLRVWDRGADTASAEAIAFTPGTAVRLEGTGLTVTLIGGDLRAGDHWVVAARPETPNRIVPWRLETGAPPDGLRVFAAPLALMRWPSGADGTVGTVLHDCRRTFRPLTRLRTCCTLTVGDGVESHGDFTSVQAAIDALPPAGGKVCLLPGEWDEAVEIRRSNVTISGCGRRSVLRAPGGATSADAVISVRDAARVSIESLHVEAVTGLGVQLAEDAGSLRDIVLRDVTVAVRDRSAIQCFGGRRVSILHCDVRGAALPAVRVSRSLTGAEPLVFVAADDVLLERNTVAASGAERLRTVAGGIQIGGGSDRVTLRRNVVRGGNGNGVTLGSVLWTTPEGRDRAADDYRAFLLAVAVHETWTSFAVDEAGCISVDPSPTPPTDEDGNPLVPVSAGALSDVVIEDNAISGMGGDGIGVARFFDLSDDEEFITVERLTISRNRIERCLRLEQPRLPARLRESAGHGGIALADCTFLLIDDNVVADNGRSHVDPVCGVFVLRGEGVTLERNRILENGPRDGSDATPRLGNRGGIVVGMATGPSAGDEGRLPRPSGQPALRLHGNIVLVPEGRALQATALGSVFVEGNHLTSRGTTALSALFRTLLGAIRGRGDEDEDEDDAAGGRSRTLIDFLGGAAVSIVNLGVTLEAAGLVSGFTKTAGFGGGRMLGSGAEVESTYRTGGLAATGLAASRLLAGGAVLFNDNQVALDLLDAERSGTLSSVLVLTLDDVSFDGNQCTCDLLSDLVLTNALLLGWSVRAADNRFVEALSIAYLSAITIGLMNSTTDNQGTHCIAAAGVPALTEREHNHALIELTAGDDSPCEALGRYGGVVGAILFGGLTRRAVDS